MKRFVIHSWVCDWGIWDKVCDRFIGAPIENYNKALAVCDWFNSLEAKEIELLALSKGE